MSPLAPLTTIAAEHLVTATGGQIVRYTARHDENLKAQLTTLQESVKDVARAASTAPNKQQETMNLVMMMSMMRR